MGQADNTHKKGLSVYWGKNRDIHEAFGSQFLIIKSTIRYATSWCFDAIISYWGMILPRWDIAKEAAEWVEVEGVDYEKSPEDVD